jgi:hypothetical protein
MRLTVDYAMTADMADGQPLPPYIDGDGAVWRVIRRLPDARTCWRRIRLSTGTSEHAIRRQVARDFISRRQTRHQNS